MNADTISVICPHCGHDRVYPVGQRGVLFVFECAECHGLLELQAREALTDKLQPITTTVRGRGDGTIEAWFTFERAAGAYPLGWVIDADKGRLRRLLDYDGWLYCDMTPAAILSAVEESEWQVTRRAWPDIPEYWCVGVQK